MADLIASQMAGYVADVQADATDLAQRPEFALAVASNDFGGLDSQLARWQATRQAKIDGLSLYSTNGMMLATARANRSLVGLPSTNADVIDRVAATGEPGRGQPLVSRTSGRPIIPIYVPVRCTAGEVCAVFAATLSLEALTTTLLALPLASNSRSQSPTTRPGCS